MDNGNALVEFLAGTGSDHRGRILADVLNWSDDQLENSHDFIQWLFPLPEESKAVPFAPVMSEEARQQIIDSSACQLGLLNATIRMTRFYGIPLQPYDGCNLFGHKIARWCDHRNHNFLRMTRILRSLSLLGKKALAEEIFTFISDEIHPNYMAVDVAMDFWTEAIKGENEWPPVQAR